MEPGDWVVTFPGTVTPVGGTIDPDKAPRIYASMIVQVVEQIVSIPYQLRMRFFMYHHQQVTIHAATPGSIPLAGHRHLHAFCHTSRNTDGDDFLIFNNSFPETMGTLMGDGFAFSSACWTGCHGLHLSQESIGDPGHLSVAVTGSTGRVA